MMTCYNRYYALRGSEDGYFHGHRVIAPHQIDSLISHNLEAEHFAGIEYYDGDKVVGSLLSFDIDFDGNLERAYYTAVQVGNVLQSFNIRYLCWFSGGKGFHLVVPKMILGDKVHILSKAIKRTFFNFAGVDEKIYRVKSLFRLEGSVNKKSGLYKIPVDLAWRLEYIKEKAKTAIPISYSIELDDSIDLRVLIDGARTLVESLSVRERLFEGDDEYEPPLCIKKMWADDDPPRDKWHDIIYTLSKHFYNMGYESHEIVDMFDEHEFWGSLCGYGYTRRSYTKVINSLARSNRRGIGCKTGTSADCMQYYCSRLCHFTGVTLGELLWEV